MPRSEPWMSSEDWDAFDEDWAAAIDNAAITGREPLCICGHDVTAHRAVPPDYTGGDACQQRHAGGVICDGYEPDLRI